MALTITHDTVATLPDDPEVEIGAGEWNENHAISGSIAWDEVDEKPATFPPDAHNHDGSYDPAGTASGLAGDLSDALADTTPANEGARLVGFQSDDTVHDTIVDILNRGLLHGFVITNTSGLNVTWTDGDIWDPASDTIIEVSAQVAPIACTDNAINYLKWTSGTTLTLSTVDASGDQVLVARLDCFDGVIHTIRQNEFLSTVVSSTRRSLRLMFPVVVLSGMVVSAKAGVGTWDVISSIGGHIEDGHAYIPSNAVDSTVTQMMRVFRVAGVWDHDHSSEIDPTKWDNGTNLVAVSASKWYKSLFLLGDDMIHWVYPQAEYSNEAQAIAGQLPTVPAGLARHVKSTAVVLRGNAAAFPTAGSNDWIDVRPILTGSAFGPITDHGALAGLEDDDHTQYHTDGRGDLRYSPIALSNGISGTATYLPKFTGAQSLGNSIITEIAGYIVVNDGYMTVRKDVAGVPSVIELMNISSPVANQGAQVGFWAMTDTEPATLVNVAAIGGILTALGGTKPGAMIFKTHTPGSGGAVPAEHMRLTSTGLGVLNNNPRYAMDVTGSMQYTGELYLTPASDPASAKMFSMTPYGDVLSGKFNIAYGWGVFAGSARRDRLFSWGYNQIGSVAKELAGEASLAYVIESFYSPSEGVEYCETYINFISNDESKSYRPIMFSCERNTGINNSLMTFTQLQMFDAVSGLQNYKFDTVGQWIYGTGLGIYKIHNNQTFLYQSNAAGDGYVNILKVNAADQVEYGSNVKFLGQAYHVHYVNINLPGGLAGPGLTISNDTSGAISMRIGGATAYYDFARTTATGYLDISGSQVAPYRGITTNCPVVIGSVGSVVEAGYKLIVATDSVEAVKIRAWNYTSARQVGFDLINTGTANAWWQIYIPASSANLNVWCPSGDIMTIAATGTRLGVAAGGVGGKLEISGNSGSNHQLHLHSGTDTMGFLVGRRLTADAFIGWMEFYAQQTGYGGFLFHNVDGYRVCIGPAGYIGIGMTTTSPICPLHVKGTSNGSATVVIQNDTINDPCLRIGHTSYHYSFDRATWGYLHVEGNQAGYTGFCFNGPMVVGSTSAMLDAIETNCHFQVVAAVGSTNLLVQEISAGTNTAAALRLACGAMSSNQAPTDWLIQVLGHDFAHRFRVYGNMAGSEGEYFTIVQGGNVGLGVVDPDEQLELTGRLHLGQVAAPATTTDKLYNVAGVLTWNAIALHGSNTHAQIDTFIASATATPTASKIPIADANGYLDGWVSPIATGWISAGETWTYASNDSPTYTLTIPTDLTGKYQAGQRVKLTQTTVKYFIITKVAYSSPNTTLTLYGGTDYTLADAAISLNFYSREKIPFGFPLDYEKWTVLITDTTTRSQASPAQNTWYNIGTTNAQIIVPIGKWHLSYNVCAYADGASTQPSTMSATLSTANNSESDSTMTGRVHVGTTNTNLLGMIYRERYLDVATKTTYYLNGMARTNPTDNIYWINTVGDGPMILKAVCAYL